MAVGFTAEDSVEELRRAYKAVKELRKALTRARKAFDRRRLTELDTEIANAWLISTEIKDRLAKAGKDLSAKRERPANEDR